MAVPKQARRQQASHSQVRDGLRRRLVRLRAFIEQRDKNVNPVFVRAFGLDRIEPLLSSGDVLVVGYEVLPYLSAPDRAVLDPNETYLLRADGTISRAER